MLKSLDLSLWDLLTFFVTGSLIIVLLEYLGIYIKIFNVFINYPVIVAFYYAIIAYTIGIIYEPVSNFIFRYIKKVYLKYIFNKGDLNHLDKERKSLKSIVKKDIKQKYFQDYFCEEGEDNFYYQVAKLKILQNGKPNTFMVFLSKYGFYRNIVTLSLFSMIVYIANMLNWGIVKSVIILISLIVIHFTSFF